MTKFRTHYDNLQISRSASLEVIKAAYRTLSAKYHPDRNRGDSHSAEIMSIINNSYAVLCDEDARRQHDAWIKRQEAARSSRASLQASAQATQPDHPFEIPAWTHAASNTARWSNAQERSAATEAALAQGRLGKISALAAAAAAACLLVLALLSEQRSLFREPATEPASASAMSERIAAAGEGASGSVVQVAARRDAPPERAIQIATNFARSEGLLAGHGYTARIHDDGDTWLISYRSPAERGAAAPIVLLDKDTLRVIGYYAAGR